LTSASSAITGAAHGATSANAAAASAAGQAGAFEGEPIGATFSAMCSQAQSATAQLEGTLGSLSRCVMLAAEGYLVTDRGIMQASAVTGAIGSGAAPTSPEGGARP
jgi:hypothetical protein